MQSNTAAFFEAIYGEDLPLITFISSPKRDARGSIIPSVHEWVRPKPMYLRKFLRQAAEGSTELFFVPVPMGNYGMPSEALAQDAAVISADVDHAFTEEQRALIERLDATVNESGGVGRHHVFVPLDVPHPPHVIKELNQALRVALDGDSKQSPASFLRVPGTYNRKGEPVLCRTVRLSSSRQTLPSVRQALRTGGESVSAQSRVGGERETPTGALSALTLPEVPEGFNWLDNKPGYARMRKCLREWNGRFAEGRNIQRHKATMAIVRDAIQYGVSRDEAYAFASRCEPLLDKQEEENGYRIDRDVARTWRRETPSATPALSESAGVRDEPAVSSRDVSRDAAAEAAFWAARPVLTHIRDFAHSRLVSSWAVFGISVARVMNQIPTEVLLPPLVGGRTGLNFYVGIVDSSGVGKGASESAAEECFEAGEVISLNIGSGEGIAHAYMSRRKATLEEVEEGMVGKGETVMEMHTHSVLFTAPEIDTLTAIKGRSSSTLSAELRKAWSGERLGFMYVTEAKRLTIEKHTYRMTLVCGVQPTRAEALLDEQGGGLPQRFLWMPANDPTIPELEDLRDAEAMPLKLPDFFHELSAPKGMVTVDVCESARREIRQHQHAKIKRTVTPDPLDSHRNLVRLKVAAALAFMDRRTGVSEEDWALADTVMSVSDRTRDFVRAEITRARSDMSRERGRDDAIREVAKREHVETETTRRVWRRLDEVLRAADKAMTVSDLQKKVPPRDREDVADVVAEMSAKGLVREAGTNRKGNAMYERAG